MEFVWNSDIPINVMETLFAILSNKLISGKPEELSLLLKSLSAIRYKWQNEGHMEKTICQAFISNYHSTEKKLENNEARTFANCIFYFGELAKLRKLDKTDTMTLDKANSMILDKAVHDSIWDGIMKCSAGFSSLGLGILCTG
jgi:hypothetical protein